MKPLPPPLVFTYTNYKGETAIRHVLPRSAEFGTAPHHLEPTWLLTAWDLDKGAVRTFDMTKIVWMEIQLPEGAMGPLAPADSALGPDQGPRTDAPGNA